MTTTRQFEPMDLLRTNGINLDRLTEQYTSDFYFSYLAKWPELFAVQEAPNGQLQGYIIGKAEGEGENWHGHVSAVTVAPSFRRMGFAARLMKHLEDVSQDLHNCYFVDLYVRVSNKVAIDMYKRLNYIIYRQIIEYYSDNAEDGYDMRKSLARDPGKDAMKPHEPLRVARHVGAPCRD
eukprot:g468.t1